jgi:transcriptional regulator with XRE-family HTH domain
MKRFGEKLKMLREHYGLSFRQLGAELGVAHTHIAFIEIGKRLPSMPLVIAIAEYFDVSFDELLDDSVDLKLK